MKNLSREINFNKKLILILILITIISVGLYTSYALFQINVVKNSVIVLKTGNINIETSIPNSQNPVVSLAVEETKTVTVTLTPNASSALLYKMYYYIPGTISTFNVSSTESFQNDIVEGTIQGVKTITFTFENTGSNPVDIELGTSGALLGSTITVPYVPLVLNTTLGLPIETRLKASSGEDTEIDFSHISSDTNGKGLYVRNNTVTDENPIYYYRGEVNNNNVKFANLCWKIVRTTSTGGTKLIYNGVPDATTGDCDNTGTDSQLPSTSAYNSSANSPAYVGYSKSSTAYAMTSGTATETWYYGAGFNSSTGRLTSAAVKLAASRHYTYAKTDATTVATNIRYYYWGSSGNTSYYISYPRSVGTISAALNKMLHDNTNISSRPSTVQTVVNTWYEGAIKNQFDDYLEDTEWCNDRSLSMAAHLGGWDPSHALGGANFNAIARYYSGYASESTHIKQTNNPILTCPTAVDRLSVAGGQLTYPTGLITLDEAVMAGGMHNAVNSTYYLNTGQTYWTMTPAVLETTYVKVTKIFADGHLEGGAGSTGTLSNAHGVRPMISLKNGLVFANGNGTVANPYTLLMS